MKLWWVPQLTQELPQKYEHKAKMVSLIYQRQKTQKVRCIKDYVISYWPIKNCIIKLLGPGVTPKLDQNER